MIGQGWEIGEGNQQLVQSEGFRMEINLDKIEEQLGHNIARAAVAVLNAAVGMIREQMINGYQDVHPVPRASKRDPEKTLKPKKGTYPHTAIRDTSALINDVQGSISETADGVEVHVGSTLQYAMFVHEGTRYLKKRPYIRDAITKGWPRLQKIWASELRQGFDEAD